MRRPGEMESPDQGRKTPNEQFDQGGGNKKCSRDLFELVTKQDDESF